MKLLKSKEAAAAVDVKSWPPVLDTGQLSGPTPRHRRGLRRNRATSSLLSSLLPTDDLPRKKSPQMYKPPTPEMLAYLDFSVSTTGILAGVKVC